MTENNAPGSEPGQGSNGGQGSEPTPPTPPENGGQGNEGAEPSGEQPVVPFAQRRAEFFAKKGWSDDEKGDEQLLTSIMELESKLGNWKETERRASEFDRIHPEFEKLSEKAKHFEDAQSRLDALREKAKLDRGDLDLKTHPIDRLTNLWRSGAISLAEIPQERQYEVQQFAREQDEHIERSAQAEATRLAERHPILKNPKAAELIARNIETGMVDSKTGKEMTPEQIIVYVEDLYNAGGKDTEERIRKETQRLKEGSMERGGSPVTTRAGMKSKTVADAFRYAQSVHNNN